MNKKLIAVNVCVAATAMMLARCVGDSSAPEDASTDAPSNDGFVQPDAPVDAGSDADAAPPPACSLTKPFGTPTALPAPINGPGDNVGIWFSGDQLTVWFDNDLSPDGGTQTLSNVYSATRAGLDASFPTPAPLVAVNAVGTGYGSSNVTITSDGLTMFFGNGFSNGYTTWIATRTDVSQAFQSVSELGSVINGDSGTENYPAWISPDGGTLYFVSNRSGGQGSRDIWAASRFSDGGFAAPAPLLNINSANSEAGMVLTPDELQAFVMRNNDSIYYTSRTSTSVPFAAPQAIAELNTFVSAHQNEMYPSYVTADGCTLYFSSSLQPQTIYSATRGK